jgi:hypothetical protein
MPFIIIAAIYASLYWAVAEVATRGEDSIVLRGSAIIGRIVWVAMLPFVWAPLRLAQIALRAVG